MGSTDVTLRDRAVDVGWVVFALVIQVAGTHLAARHHVHVRALNGGAYALLVIGPLSLIARRRYPVAVLAVVSAATLAYSAIGYPTGPIWASLIIAFFTAVVVGHRRAAQVSLVVGFVVSNWAGELFGTRPGPTAVSVLGVGALLLVLLTLAELARVRHDRLIEARRLAEEEARRQAGEERLRIARELHDVLAHSISLINVQAGTALHLMDDEPERARHALSAIKDVSKEALGELRSVLQVLRQVDEAAPRAPTPGAARLGELVERASAAGVQARLETGGTERPLSAGVDLAVFRIVQEALTNVTRHGGSPPPHATVLITYREDDIVVQVDDDGIGPSNGTSGGNGLPGMRERATALGGRLSAGARPGGGFRVRAWLPLGDDS